MDNFNADKLIKLALEEDITSEDISTNAVMKEYKKGAVSLICKQDGVICGLEVFERVFKILDENTEVNLLAKDGEKVKKGQHIAELTGDIRVLLSGERTALNYLQRMSGIATYTSEVAALLKGGKTKLLDTRKTTPNMRIFEKYAVKCGGGHKIEVEVENLNMCREALEAGADIIMLDNMSVEDMKKAVKLINGRALTECSGNVTRENIKNIIDAGVDFVSSGALTHSAPILDLSLKNLHPVEAQ